MRPVDQDALRGLLAEEAARAPMSVAPVDALERGGRARKTRRTTALGSAALALVAVPVTAIALHGGTDTAVDADALNRLSTGDGPRSPFRFVEPGEPIRVEPGGQTMTLDAEGYCRTDDDGFETCKSAVDGNQGPGSPSLQGGYDEEAQRHYYYGLYIGEEAPARIVVGSDEAELNATIVSLPGDPGWVAYYAVGPRVEPDPTTPGMLDGVTVYDENGGVLGRLGRHGS